jgi:hypothetical protein
LEITAHFVIKQCEPIGNPEDKDSTGPRNFVHVDSLHNSLCDVHAAGGFKAVVAIEECLFGQKPLDLRLLDDFLAH